MEASDVSEERGFLHSEDTSQGFERVFSDSNLSFDSLHTLFLEMPVASSVEVVAYNRPAGDVQQVSHDISRFSVEEVKLYSLAIKHSWKESETKDVLNILRDPFFDPKRIGADIEALV